MGQRVGQRRVGGSGITCQHCQFQNCRVVPIVRLASGFTYVETYLARSTEAEKQSQLTRLKDFQTRNAGQYRHSM